MSRYTIPAQDARYAVVVGWNHPLESFFCAVFDTTVDEDNDAACVLWEGTALRAIPTVEALAAAVQSFAILPAAVVQQLRHDRAHAAPRSPLQEQMLRLFHPCEEERRYGKPE